MTTLVTAAHAHHSEVRALLWIQTRTTTATRLARGRPAPAHRAGGLAQGVHPYGGDHCTGDEVGLRREAHEAPPSVSKDASRC